MSGGDNCYRLCTKLFSFIVNLILRVKFCSKSIWILCSF